MDLYEEAEGCTQRVQGGLTGHRLQLGSNDIGKGEDSKPTRVAIVPKSGAIGGSVGTKGERGRT